MWTAAFIQQDKFLTSKCIEIKPFYISIFCKLNSVDGRLFPPSRETSSHWWISFGTDSRFFLIKLHQMTCHGTINIVLHAIYEVIITYYSWCAFAGGEYCFSRHRTTGKFYIGDQWKDFVLMAKNVSSGSPLLKIAWAVSPFYDPNINRQTSVQV